MHKVLSTMKVFFFPFFLPLMTEEEKITKLILCHNNVYFVHMNIFIRQLVMKTSFLIFTLDSAVLLYESHRKKIKAALTSTLKLNMYPQ